MSGPGVRAWLMRVHPSLGENEARRARLSAALVFALFASDALGLALSLQSGFQTSAAFWVTATLLPILGVGYAFTRTRHFQVGALLACVALVAGTWMLHAFQPDPDEAEVLLHYLVLPILAANLLLPWRWAVLVLASVVLVAVVPAEELIGTSHPHGAGNDLGVLVFLAIVGVAGAVFGVVNSRNQELLESEMQESSRAYAAVREADAQRVRMLHQIAHDMATPITPIRLQMRLLRPEVSDAGQHHMDVVERNVAQVQRLVADIGDLARVEGGNLRIAPQETCLADLVREAVEGQAPPAAERAITLTVDAPPHLPVHVDKDRIMQVLYNLMGNAIKFTPEGGRVHVAAAARDGWAEIAVTDSGPGLDAQQIEGLFKPFSQVHEEHARKGTGLGLFIAKGIVEAHGGTVEAQSPGPGRGSTFRFRIPAL